MTEKLIISIIGTFLEVIFLFPLDALRVFSLSLVFCSFTMMNAVKLIYLSHFAHTNCVSLGQRSLVGYSPWACEESDTTETLPVTLIWGQGLLLVPEHRISSILNISNSLCSMRP